MNQVPRLGGSSGGSWFSNFRHYMARGDRGELAHLTGTAWLDVLWQKGA